MTPLSRDSTPEAQRKHYKLMPKLPLKEVRERLNQVYLQKLGEYIGG